MTLQERAKHCHSIIQGMSNPEQLRRIFGCIRESVTEDREACANLAEELGAFYVASAIRGKSVQD